MLASNLMCSCKSSLSCSWRLILSEPIAVATHSESLLQQWLLPDGTIQGLPAEAVLDARTWAWRYYASATSTTQALASLKRRVESMRRQWKKANMQPACVFARVSLDT
jgi:hypothetical protein